MMEVHIALFAASVSAVIGLVGIVLNAYQAMIVAHMKSTDSRKNVVHKKQFEYEFNLYEKIWQDIVDLDSKSIKFSTMGLIKNANKYQNTEQAYKGLLADLHEMKETMTNLFMDLQKYSPFISSEVFLEFYKTLNSFNDFLSYLGEPFSEDAIIADDFRKAHNSVLYTKYVENRKNLSKMIRSRIESMKA